MAFSDSDAGIGVGTPVSTTVTISTAVTSTTDPTSVPRITETTLLPLARYAEIMQIPLPHFFQMNGAKAPLVGGCDDIWDQDARDFLAWTILQAEEMIAEELGFWPAPKFITNEELNFGLEGVQSNWLNAETRTKWGYVQNYGVEKLTLVMADAGVQYSNSNNNPFGRENQALIGTSIYADLPACSRPCDVAVFFRVADGAEDAADPRYEIRPIKVDIDNSVMRITADSSLFVFPHLHSLTKQDCLGSDDTGKWKWNFEQANLVDMVDVYCRTVNLSTPVSLRWDGVCNCTDTCAHQTQTGCAYPTDLRRGFFVPRPATWNGTANIKGYPLYSIPPESVKVSYLAGYPLDVKTCRMNPQLERAIVKLTNVLLPEPPCGFCDAANTRWNNDRMSIDPLTPEAASLPWDLYAKGALEAWRIVKKFARGRGGMI